MTDDLRALLDREEIRTLLNRYATRIDACDVAGVVACFTDDAVVELSGGEHLLVGRAALTAHWTSSLGSVPGMTRATTHLVGDVLIELDGDVAAVLSQAIAVLHLGDDASVRGLRYRDECRRTADGWRIARRTHHAVWQLRAEPVAIASPATAVRDARSSR